MRTSGAISRFATLCLVFAPCRFLNSMSVKTSKVHFVANRGGLIEGLYPGRIHINIAGYIS